MDTDDAGTRGVCNGGVSDKTVSQKACVRSPKKCGADFSVSEVPISIVYSLMFAQMNLISAAEKCGAFERKV